MESHIGYKRRLHHPGLKSLPVRAVEESVNFDLLGALAAGPTAQTSLGRFHKQLLTKRLGFFAKLRRVLLHVFLDASVDLLTFHLLFSGSERRLTLDHLVD